MPASVMGAFVQRGTAGSFTCRRHFPICMTSGISTSAGTSFSVKFPAASVSVIATGLPVTVPSHLSHEAPLRIGAGVVFGT